MRQLLPRLDRSIYCCFYIGVIDQPIDWLGGGFAAVILLKCRHLSDHVFRDLEHFKQYHSGKTPAQPVDGLIQ